MTRPVQSLKRFCVDRPALKRRVKRLRYLGLRSLAAGLGWDLDPRPRILGYHAVGEGEHDLSVSMEQFRRQLDWLHDRRYYLITLREWYRLVAAGEPIAPRTVVLTFDDGYRSVLLQAAPLLMAQGLRATVFVPTDCLGQTNAFDRPFGAPELPLLGWAELDQLKRLGWDVQSHGCRHYPMVRLLPGVLREELERSKATLERRLGDRIDFFCYPYGAFDAPAVAAAARAGYAGAVTCRSGVLPDASADGPSTRPPAVGGGLWYHLPRSLVDGLMSLHDFAAFFRAGYRKVDALACRLRDGRLAECPFDELDKLAHLGIFQPDPVTGGMR